MDIIDRDVMLKVIYEVLTKDDMTAERAVGAIIDYCGTQIFTEGFAEFLVDEGFATEEDFADCCAEEAENGEED